MKTNVYIDAFNLYFGCLKNSNYKWLNIWELATSSLPNDQINEIKYFTARVKPRQDDPDKPLRQQVYLRALATLPKVKIIEGHYLTQKVLMALVSPPPNGSKTVQVWKTEEKGSDVNLASHLLHDGHLGKYELAVVISNDSDLVEPIRLVIADLGLQVGVLNPQISKGSHPSIQLKKTASFFRYIRASDLKQSQFPVLMTDSKGTISKPTKW